MTLIKSRIWSGVARLQRHSRSRRQIKADILRLEPWYQPIPFGFGLNTIARDKRGGHIGIASSDRGLVKWRQFVEPNLPCLLDGKRVLEIGCNAGLFPIHCVRKLGAREAVGIEKDDRYYAQARWATETFAKLDGRYLPVRIYQGSMESFDYEGLGRFDLALMLAVIYHIGKSDDYAGLSPEQVRQIQIDTLRKVARVAKYIVFQANPLEDEGRGKGIRSLNDLVAGAGLTVATEARYQHPRGYILVAGSEAYQDRENFPIARMCNKYFLPAGQSAEREVVDLWADDEPDGFDITKTRYYRLRTARADWLAPGMAHLPEGLDNMPRYWVMPWAFKLRESGDVAARTAAFPAVWARFRETMNSIHSNGFDPIRGPIPGYKLVHPQHGTVFVFTDGNQRMGAVSHFASRQGNETATIPVEVRQEIHRAHVTRLPLARQLVEEGYLTHADVLRWFDNAFWFVKKG